MVIATAEGHSFQSFDDSESTPLRRGGTRNFFFGVSGELAPGPEGFLVNCLPDHEVDSHFHRIDQYQIMFGAPGAYYQRHPLPKALLHYTDAYSVYGPFGSGPEAGMSFFTLRAKASDIHASMPQSRDKLAYRGARHHQVDLEPMLEAEMPAKGESALDVLIEPERDGLAAYLLRLGPAGEASPPPGELRTGRYSVVLAGTVLLDGREYGSKSVGWSSGDVDDVTLEGGPDGCALVFLHLPYPDTPSVHLG